MTDDRETSGRTHRTVKKRGEKKQANRVFPNLTNQEDMGTKQNLQHGVLCLEWTDNHVDFINCGWKCLTELQRGDRNGNRNRGTIHRGGQDQTRQSDREDGENAQRCDMEAKRGASQGRWW